MEAIQSFEARGLIRACPVGHPVHDRSSAVIPQTTKPYPELCTPPARERDRRDELRECSVGGWMDGWMGRDKVLTRRLPLCNTASMGKQHRDARNSLLGPVVCDEQPESLLGRTSSIVNSSVVSKPVKSGCAM